MSAEVFPELVTGRDDAFEQGAWRVVAGTSRRGGASCNMTERVLEVPLSSDATARVVRAHELMHIRISPHLPTVGLLDGVSARALECAEELRVNTLLSSLGFSTQLLRDGTEKLGARQTAQNRDWREAVRFLLAVIGTGGEREFLAGVKSEQPTWIAGLRAVKKRALKINADLGLEVLASTRVGVEGIGMGYRQSTVAIAKLVDLAGDSMAPVGTEALRQFRRALEPGGRRAPSGRFADLVFDDSIVRSPRVRRTSTRSISPSTSGTVLRYPGRLLTDPQGRAFGAKSRARGGVVVIDQSGSMDVGVEELQDLLNFAPDAVIVGYSHRPGDNGLTPNAWVLANNTGVVETAPVGNVGNGVDAPVLAWAARQARRKGPIVWVTDGQVTDSNDHPNDALSNECAILVRTNRIRLVRNLGEAGRALRCHTPLVPSNFGRVGRKLAENKGKIP